jgi:2-keto-3-deoxy-L-rhamnonate aldolase RhmA
MAFGELIPIVAIAASAWVVVTGMRYRHAGGRGRAGKGAAAVETEAKGDNARLARENEDLRHTVGRLEERLRVLERIATDPAERTAREIESLR